MHFRVSKLFRPSALVVSLNNWNVRPYVPEEMAKTLIFHRYFKRNDITFYFILSSPVDIHLQRFFEGFKTVTILQSSPKPLNERLENGIETVEYLPNNNWPKT